MKAWMAWIGIFLKNASKICERSLRSDLKKNRLLHFGNVEKPTGVLGLRHIWTLNTNLGTFPFCDIRGACDAQISCCWAEIFFIVRFSLTLVPVIAWNNPEPFDSIKMNITIFESKLRSIRRVRVNFCFNNFFVDDCRVFADINSRVISIDSIFIECPLCIEIDQNSLTTWRLVDTVSPIGPVSERTSADIRVIQYYYLYKRSGRVGHENRGLRSQNLTLDLKKSWRAFF